MLSVKTILDTHQGPGRFNGNSPSACLVAEAMGGVAREALRATSGKGMQLFDVSGYAQPVQRAIEAGFDGHLAKPCAPEQIERLLG
jgi:hypothetical protein